MSQYAGKSMDRREQNYHLRNLSNAAILTAISATIAVFSIAHGDWRLTLMSGALALLFLLDAREAYRRRFKQ